MSLQTWEEVLVTSITDGTALTASTTPTSILPSQSILTLPSNFFYVGRQIRLRASGRVTTVVTTPGTLTLDIRFNTSVIVANGGAIPLTTVAQTNDTWSLEWLLTCRTVGSGTAATLMHTGVFLSSAGNPIVSMLPATAPAVGTGFDSTAAQTVNLFATWSLNNADSILCHQYHLEATN